MLQVLLEKVKIKSCITCLFWGCARQKAGTRMAAPEAARQVRQALGDNVEGGGLLACTGIKTCQLALEWENM